MPEYILETRLILKHADARPDKVSFEAHSLSAIQRIMLSRYIGREIPKGNIWEAIMFFSVSFNEKSLQAFLRALPGCVKP